MPLQLDVVISLHWTSGYITLDITWTSQCQNVFEEAKASLSTNSLLHHPRPNVKTSITVDASDSAIGAELEQSQKRRWVPLAFFSRKLSTIEKNIVLLTAKC